MFLSFIKVVRNLGIKEPCDLSYATFLWQSNLQCNLHLPNMLEYLISFQ